MDASRAELIVTWTNLVSHSGWAYEAPIAGGWLAQERVADAGTLFREARVQA